MKMVVGAIIFLLVLAASKNGYSWEPEKELVGVWQTKAEILASFEKGKYPSRLPEDSIKIVIQILPDGRVEGTVEDAHFSDCRVKPNRGWLGRFLNFKTDYIITDGLLVGPINANDPETKRTFTIPFNLINNQLRGSLMVTKPWKYPDSLVSRLIMDKC